MFNDRVKYIKQLVLAPGDNFSRESAGMSWIPPVVYLVLLIFKSQYTSNTV